MIPLLHTDRMRLRLPDLRDAERIAGFLDDFGVSGNLARVPHPYTLRDARAWLGTRRPHLTAEETVFAMEIEGEGVIGHVGFHLGEHRLPVIGYWLGRPYWGHGLMSEAVAASLAWFFAHSAANRVISGVFDFNLPSLAIQKKYGFVETGRSRLMCLARGRELGHIDTELARAHWLAHVGGRLPAAGAGDAAASS